MRFSSLCKYFEEVEKTSSRLEMTQILSSALSECSGSEAAVLCYLITARVAPMFVPIEFNIADKTILKVLEGVRNSSQARRGAEELFNELGDLGLVAEELVKQNRSSGMPVMAVYGELWKIAQTGGKGSMECKQKLVGDLLAKMEPLEAKYTIRILAQKLRLGSSSKTILDALSVLSKDDKTDRDEIERAYGVCSDLGHVAEVYIAKGLSGVKSLSITPGVPVFSMLVEREKDLESVYKRIPNSIVQPKYDGIRCQIHVGQEGDKGLDSRVWHKYLDRAEDEQQTFLTSKSPEGKRVWLFSRNLEDMTHMFPEVVEAAENLKVDSAVLDTEVIGFDEDSGEYSPFQETMVRKRKYDVKNISQKVPVKSFAFDMLYLNGESLIQEKNSKRIEVLTQVLKSGSKNSKDALRLSSSLVAVSAGGLSKVFQESISSGLEGVIVKEPTSTYKPGRRGFDWIKMKRAFQGKLADTVDVVILGYYFGRGRKADFGIGALLGGVYDTDKDEFVTLAKIGTGISDDMWRRIKKDLDSNKLENIPKRVSVDKGLTPDVWVYPDIVAAVEADEITRSPVHTCGKDKEGSGLALRFPRLKEWKRDKTAEDCTSVTEVVEMYQDQKKG